MSSWPSGSHVPPGSWSEEGDQIHGGYFQWNSKCSLSIGKHLITCPQPLLDGCVSNYNSVSAQEGTADAGG